jgi:hypothetical protein
VWLNSSVRGPYLPAYLAGRMHWTEALTGKLTDRVKLVGATINCGGGYLHPEPQPHVQSYVVALDQVPIDRGHAMCDAHANVAATVDRLSPAHAARPSLGDRGVVGLSSTSQRCQRALHLIATMPQSVKSAPLYQGTTVASILSCQTRLT